ncbi:hypothetical protein Tco_1269116, partial [Tanacetum coccineum]
MSDLDVAGYNICTGKITAKIENIGLSATVGLFKGLERVKSIAYKLKLLQELSRVHNTFHISNLKKCCSDDPLAIPLEGLHIDDKFHLVEEPVVGLFKGLERVESIAYKLKLLQELSRVHNTFHISNLKKCCFDDPLAIPLEGLHIDDKFHLVEEPVVI